MSLEQLKKGEKIYISDGKIEFTLLEDAHKKVRNESLITWYATAKNQNGYTYFIKYTSYEDDISVSILNRESKFKIKYPHIENIYGDFKGQDEKGNVIYGITAEFINGKMLYDCFDIENNNEVTEEQMFKFMLCLLKTVRHYSQYSVKDFFVHRDIKPENVMIDKDRVVLIDFDWAHVPGSEFTRIALNSENGEEGVGGTPGYMHPLAMVSTEVTIQMDIYSLGLLFCFMLRGKHYFQGSEKREYVKNKELAFTLVADKIPEKYRKPEYQKLLGIIAGMIAERDKQYTNLDDVVNDMQDFLIERYGEEKYIELFLEDNILQDNEFQDVDKSLQVGIYNTFEKKRKTFLVKNNEVYDVVINNQLVMIVYNLDGELYFVPYVELFADENCVRNGDKVIYGDRDGREIKVDFMISKVSR